ncbi:universal stress protein [Nonomuraea jabiensis]|uniref:universal stress protein n=1 Tax=Nonomuraea jabiensis TaxID=882448 RepID=UPI003D718064
MIIHKSGESAVPPNLADYERGRTAYGSRWPSISPGCTRAPSSAGGRAATDFAFAEAALRGARLHAVHAWGAVSDGLATSPTGEAGRRRRLPAEAVADFRARYPGVKLVTRLVRGHPVDVLPRASAESGLLVVGSRGRGPVTAFFGSVSYALVQYTRCRMVVVAVVDEG